MLQVRATNVIQCSMLRQPIFVISLLKVKWTFFCRFRNLLGFIATHSYPPCHIVMNVNHIAVTLPYMEDQEKGLKKTKRINNMI